MSTRVAADLLIEARWLLPIAPVNGVLAAHAVVVSDGRILALGPAAELRTRFAPRQELLRPRHVLLPGLVNAHASAAHTLLRGVSARAAEHALNAAGADFVRDGTRLAIAEMLRAGITCFADLSALPDEAARTAAAAQMRAVIGLPVADGPTPWAENATAHLAKAERLWDEYRADPRIGWYFAPLAPHFLSDATLARVRRVTDELDARIAVRLDAPPGYARPVRTAAAGAVEDGGTPRGARVLLERLLALGLLRPGFSALGAGLAEAELLERHGASLIVCPQAQLRAGALPAPLPLLSDNRTALGTDSAPAAGALDMLAEVRTAALMSGLGAAEALRLATLGGATVLGLGSQIGSIEPGKAADLICVELDTVACRPEAGVPEALVFAATRAAVSEVWTGGRLVVSAGQLLTFDEEELAALPGRWARQLGLEAAA
jgi:5-methylthioadenosine/S-adenosylhomocysteine deaminase